MATIKRSKATVQLWYDVQMLELDDLLAKIRLLHDRIRERVLQATKTQSHEQLAKIVEDDVDGSGDLVFAIDRVSEDELIEFVTEKIASVEPILLICEGIPNGQMVLPAGADQESCRWRMIVDPIDGTRPLMYQKRSGWILTGIAPNRGPTTGLADIELAVQTEIPIVKQNLSDQLWAIRGRGATSERFDVLTRERQKVELRPSTADTIQYGYVSVGRYFPGMRDVLAAIEDEIITQVLGPRPPGGTLTYEDQYPSTGGQIYSLLSGADRFLADLRPLMTGIAAERGENMMHCCHPYDICTLLIAEELGVTITSPAGGPLTIPLDVTTDVAWVGYANEKIRKQVESELQAALQQRDLIQKKNWEQK